MLRCGVLGISGLMLKAENPDNRTRWQDGEAADRTSNTGTYLLPPEEIRMFC